MDIKIIETKEYTQVLKCIKTFFVDESDKDVKGRLTLGDSTYCNKSFYQPVLITDESDIVLNNILNN